MSSLVKSGLINSGRVNSGRVNSGPVKALRLFDLGVVSPLLMLAVWQGVASAALFPAEILVPPRDVALAFFEVLQSGEFQQHLLLSLQRLLTGFAVGAGLGILFGGAMAFSKPVAVYCGPLFHALRQIPAIALIPLFILLFGIDELFKIVVVAKAAFFPVAIAAHDGVRGVPRSYRDLAAVYKTPYGVYVRRVIFPAAMPSILSGLRISLSRSWTVLVAAELLAAGEGLGQMMEMGRQMFRIDIVMVGVVTAGLVGFVLDKGFKLAERRLLRWRGA